LRDKAIDDFVLQSVRDIFTTADNFETMIAVMTQEDKATIIVGGESENPRAGLIASMLTIANTLREDSTGELKTALDHLLSLQDSIIKSH